MINSPGKSRLTRAVALAVPALIVGAAMVAVTPGVSNAAGPGGSVTFVGSCSANGYPEETYITESFTGLSTTNTPGYEVKFTYTPPGGTVATFLDGNWETNPDHSGSYQSNFFGPALQPATSIAWEVDAIEGSTLDPVITGSGGVSGNACTPHSPPAAPEFGDTSDKATNAGVVTMPIEVTPKSSGTLEILNSGNGVIAAGSYNDSSSNRSPCGHRLREREGPAHQGAVGSPVVRPVLVAPHENHVDQQLRHGDHQRHP